MTKTLLNSANQPGPLLSVVILNWNTRDLLRDCLQSVFDSWQTPVGTGRRPIPTIEVIVIDNNSSDDSVKMVKKEFPQAKLICNKKNLGFARGNNRGIKKAQGKYTLILNSDTIIKKGALQKMIAAAEKDKKIGALGPRLLNQDDSDQWHFHRKFPSLAQIFWVYTTILGRLTPHIPLLRQHYLSNENREKSGQTQLQLSGAALMMPTKLLKKLGGFDKNFFFWLEDVDLCWRIKALGYKLYYEAQAEIIHLGGASSAKWSNFERLYNFRLSMLKYFKKHQPDQAKWVRGIFLVDVLIMIPIALIIKPTQIKAYIRFLREF